MSKKNYRRGYPVAILIGLEIDHAVIWQIFSRVAKPQQTLFLSSSRKDQKGIYTFHESIVNALRSILKEGIRSIIISSPLKTNYGQEFHSHISIHHSWLLQGSNKASISLMIGEASSASQVAVLTQKPSFKQLVIENTAEETENLLEILEKRLSNTNRQVFFSLIEAEKLVLNQQLPGKPQPEYLLLTDSYLNNNHQRARLNRLLQIAQNKEIKTRVVNSKSKAGIRLSQLGGIVCLVR